MLGRMLVPNLEKLGYELMVLGNERIWPKSIPCDIRNYKQIHSISARFKPDIIIHLAGITGNLECETSVQNAILTNIVGTYNILESNIKNKAKVIFASTREVYRETEELLEESSDLDPKNINGITKTYAEKLTRDFFTKYGMPFIILRFSNFLGENNERKGISTMLRNAIQRNKIRVFGGEQEIDPLHYDDAVAAILKSLEYQKSDTFNIAGGKSVTVTNFVKRLENLLGRNIKITHMRQREFESTYCRLDVRKADKLFGFKATENIDTILERMVSRWAKM